MPGLRHIALSDPVQFMPAQGIVYDVDADTYIRLRRTETLRFDCTARRQHAYLGNVQLTWPESRLPEFRTQLTNWWANIKE